MSNEEKGVFNYFFFNINMLCFYIKSFLTSKEEKPVSDPGLSIYHWNFDIITLMVMHADMHKCMYTCM